MIYACAFLIWCAAVALWPTRAELARRRTRNRATVAPVASHLLHIPGGILHQTWHPDNVDAREIARDRAAAEAEAEAEATTIGREPERVPLSAPLITWPVPKRGER